MKFHNLAASQKAVYQPAFKHRRWLEQRKERSAEGHESIAQMETNLPALRGPEASIANHESDLKTFYDNLVLKEHLWDDKRARDREFKLAAERLLKMIGGTPGKKRDNDNKVVISIRLGEFSSTPRLSSLHTAFSAYFVQLARSQEYSAMGVNEYYTSKRCPVCKEFVGQPYYMLPPRVFN
ncbi:hypothetical protein BC939DRAFT_469238 [Gamsiella multidivaricata]|uniref:uncharacterized protein n=1 Tax=Gamsiella multidivaricata TaxID=101098 RepID=UPI00221EC43B|nr:uncharacterized protein BC939DRAFT_469238 [Gamsiella multidivaricata]KAI7816405.1 hypothetical protein BC939DRAFT_469238 [Gamsiella multidivaricata]